MRKTRRLRAVGSSGLVGSPAWAHPVAQYQEWKETGYKEGRQEPQSNYAHFHYPTGKAGHLNKPLITTLISQPKDHRLKSPDRYYPNRSKPDCHTGLD